MKDDIETVRIALVACAGSLEGELKARYGEPVHSALLKKWNSDMQDVYEAREATAALDRLQARVADLENISKNDQACIKLLTHGLNERNADRDSLRAKLDEIEQALTECGMPAQLGNPPEPWPARDRILGAYADYLKRHNEACKIDMENWSLRAKLERAKEAGGKVIFRAEECGALRDPEATDFGSSLANLRAVLAEISADAPARLASEHYTLRAKLERAKEALDKCLSAYILELTVPVITGLTNAEAETDAAVMFVRSVLAELSDDAPAQETAE